MKEFNICYYILFFLIDKIVCFNEGKALEQLPCSVWNFHFFRCAAICAPVLQWGLFTYTARPILEVQARSGLENNYHFWASPVTHCEKWPEWMRQRLMGLASFCNLLNSRALLRYFSWKMIAISHIVCLQSNVNVMSHIIKSPFSLPWGQPVCWSIRKEPKYIPRRGGVQIHPLYLNILCPKDVHFLGCTGGEVFSKVGIY